MATRNYKPPDPTAAYRQVLDADPALLRAAEENQRGDGVRRNIIRAWDEIPDVMTMAAPRIEWVVEGIIPRASVTLLAGEPGSYKSWLALALLRGAVAGEKFLERQCAALSVLYLDRENPLTVVRERLAMLGVESLGSARIWGGWLPDSPPAIGDMRLL